MRAVIILSVLLLAGCESWSPVRPEPKIIVQHEYFVRIPPAETMTLPPPIAPIENLDKADQADAARWIARNEDRIKSLESKLQETARFLSAEQAKLDEEAKKKTEESRKNALK